MKIEDLRVFLQINKDVLNINAIGKHLCIRHGRMAAFVTPHPSRSLGSSYLDLNREEIGMALDLLRDMCNGMKNIRTYGQHEMRYFFEKYRKLISLRSFSIRSGVIHSRSVAFADGVINPKKGLIYKKFYRNDYDHMYSVFQDIIRSFDDYIFK